MDRIEIAKNASALKVVGRVATAVALTAPAIWSVDSSTAQTMSNAILDRAHAGFVQCFAPDVSTRTCSGMTTYRFEQNGGIATDTISLLQENPPIIMHVISPVVAQGAGLCGGTRDQDVDAATFEVAGSPADAQQTSQLRAALRASPRPQTCLRLAVDGSALMTWTVNGQAFESTSQVAWVRPDDGYTVRGHASAQ